MSVKESQVIGIFCETVAGSVVRSPEFPANFTTSTRQLWYYNTNGI
ncbi:hypothetical protein IQ259_21990 [Fortiea sp. LEGE XX443]|nr:hypothetical protein [Fortiea sp. LEGE XX443]